MTRALILACLNGNVEIVRWLVDLGVDMSAEVRDGRNAFLAAIQNNHVELIKYLLTKGADLDCRTQRGNDEFVC